MTKDANRKGKSQTKRKLAKSMDNSAHYDADKCKSLRL